MKRRFSIAIRLAVFAAGILGISTPQAGTVHRAVEDFTTIQYNDTASTTAMWAGGSLGFYPFEPSLVGENDTPGYARDLFVSGNHVFMADGEFGLQVFDITDPANPTHVANWNTTGFSSDVEVAGNVAYVADGLDGLQFFWVEDPTQPVKIAGGYDTDGYSRGVTIESNFAYVADGEPGGQAKLLVFDVSDISIPILAGSLDVAGLAIGSFVAGDHLYFAGGPGGMHIIDISDPASPSLVSTFPTTFYARNVVVAGGRAYLATAESGLYIIDVSNPASPTLLGSYDTSDYGFGVAVSGNIVALADDENGVQLFDVTEVGMALHRSTIDTPAKAIGVRIAGNHVYVADGPASLQVIEIGEPIGPLNGGSHTTLGSALCTAIDGDRVFVVTPGGLEVYRHLAGSLQRLGSVAAQIDGIGDIAVDGSHVFVAAGPTSGLLLFDVSNPANPTLLSSLATGADVRGVAVAGDYAFVADGDAGLNVVDIKNPLAMTDVATHSLPGRPRRVALAGNTAYVTSEGFGFIPFDIRNRAFPNQLGGFLTEAFDVALSGDHAFVTTGNGLATFDIREPTDFNGPYLVDSLSTPGTALTVSVAGNIAVVGDAPGTLYRIDISDPLNLGFAGTMQTNDTRDVMIAGDFAAVADGAWGVQMVEVFNRAVDRSRNIAQSLNVLPTTDEILRARLTTIQTDSIAWQLSRGDTNWIAAVPSGPWIALDPPATELTWRSALDYQGLVSGNASCDQLEIEWLHHYAAIDSVTDAPADSGGFVDVHFSRSGHDFSDDATPVTQYVLVRRMEATMSLTTHADGASPSGSWETAARVLPQYQDQYVVRLPTFADSSAVFELSVYAVITDINSESFWSPPDSGYSVDNSIVVTSFDASRSGNSVRLTWDVGGSVSGFNVYRSTQPVGFEPLNPGLLPSSAVSYTDVSVVPGGTYWYRLGVVDGQGDETLSSDATISIPGTSFALYQNQPNPFNPTTQINYTIPSAGPVTLRIFDVAGRLIRTLVDTKQIEGAKTVDWDGTDDNNHRVASGVYFYRLEAAGLEQTRKMTLRK